MDISILVIVGYLVGVTIIGSLLARKTTSSADWAVAGGGMSMLMMAFGVAGTRIGGAGTYGVAGNVIGTGLWNMWWYSINTFLALAIVGLFFAKPYRRLRLQTVGEIFSLRFGSRRNQVLTSLCVQTEYAIVDIIEAYVIGAMLAALTPLNMFGGVVVAAVVLITYTTLGGLWGTAVTNLIHCAVIIFGLLAVGLTGIADFGGWSDVTALVDGYLAESQKDAVEWWRFTGLGWGAVLGMFFSAAVHTPAASVYTNYSTSASSERNLIPGFLLAGGIAALMPLLAGLIGILTVARYGFESGLRSYLNLTQLATDIDPIIGGIALAAVLAAVISSGGPILLSSATMFVRDWLPFTSDWPSQSQLKAYRITTIIYGALAAVAAWYIATRTNISILDLLLFGFAMVVPPAIAVGYLIYWKRTTEPGAFWGMISGYGAGLVHFLAIKWALAVGFEVPDDASPLRQLLGFLLTHDGVGVDPSYATTIVPVVVVPLVSLLTPSQAEGANEFYAKVHGKTPTEARDA